MASQEWRSVVRSEIIPINADFQKISNSYLADMPLFMKNGDRIVGGQNAPSPIPWQIIKEYGCGGTILDSTTILSAAHCSYYIGEWIRAGSLKRYSGGQVCMLGLGRTLPELVLKYFSILGQKDCTNH